MLLSLWVIKFFRFVTNYNHCFSKDHLQKSHPNPVCEYCGKKFDSTNSLDSHKLIKCVEMIVSCPLKDLSCFSIHKHWDSSLFLLTFLINSNQNLVQWNYHSFKIMSSHSEKLQANGILNGPAFRCTRFWLVENWE